VIQSREVFDQIHLADLSAPCAPAMPI